MWRDKLEPYISYDSSRLKCYFIHLHILDRPINTYRMNVAMRTVIIYIRVNDNIDFNNNDVDYDDDKVNVLNTVSIFN